MSDSAKVAQGHSSRQYGKDLLRSGQRETSCDVGKTGTLSNPEVGLLLSELVNIVGAILTSKPTHVWQVQ